MSVAAVDPAGPPPTTSTSHDRGPTATIMRPPAGSKARPLSGPGAPVRTGAIPAPTSARQDPAVHGEDVAGDHRGRVGQEEDGRSRQLVGLAETADGDAGHDALAVAGLRVDQARPRRLEPGRSDG